jgi:glycolate oxidase
MHEMLPVTVIQELEGILGRDNIIVDEHRIMAYDCDAYVAEKFMPSAVVFPQTTEQVVAIVRCLAREGIPFLPRGAGTGLSGGATPMNHEVVISLAKMDQLLNLDFENRRATVQPGFVNLMLTKRVANNGYYYAPDPSSQSVCTIGGNFAENSGGSHCLKYGVTTNHVVAAEVVLPSGEIVTVGEPYGDPVGLDLLGVLVGSEGTLGITTAITVKILPKPQAVKTILAYFDQVDDASQTVSDIIAQGIVPAACEIMDQLMIHAVEKSVYHVGYPQDIEAVLLVELDGMLESVEDNAQRVLDVCAQNHVRTSRIAQDDRERALWWNSRKMAFPAIGRISPDYLVQDGVIPRTKLSAALQRVSALSEEYGLRVANVFHAGDGNLHPLICYDARVEGQLQQALALGQRILEVCVDMGGSITGEHGVGIEKIGHMAYMFSEEEIKAQIDLRRVFDPQGLCNAGKLIPSPGACVENRSAHHTDDTVLAGVSQGGEHL